MNANIKSGMPTIPMATDAEISAAAKQLGLNGARSDSRRKPGVGQVLQSLAHGRSHMVSVAIKPSSRRLGGSRRYKLADDDPISVRR
jgi:ribosomal protein S18 acetylase RimI-like enzyme